MTQLDLLSAPVETLTDQMAAYFRQRPGQAISFHVLNSHFGHGGWRTRLSELRFAPYCMDITNRQFTIQTIHGKRRDTYRPAAAQGEAA